MSLFVDGRLQSTPGHRGAVTDCRGSVFASWLQRGKHHHRLHPRRAVRGGHAPAAGFTAWRWSSLSACCSSISSLPSPAFTLHCQRPELSRHLPASCWRPAFLTSSLTMPGSSSQARQAARKAYRTEVLLDTSQKLQQGGADGRSFWSTWPASSSSCWTGRCLSIRCAAGPGEPARLHSSPAHSGDTGPALLAADERGGGPLGASTTTSTPAPTTNTLPERQMPLSRGARARQRLGGGGHLPIGGRAELDAFEKNLMLAILDECGLALEKERLAEEKRAEDAALAAGAAAGQPAAGDLPRPAHPADRASRGNAGILMENAQMLDEAKKQRSSTPTSTTTPCGWSTWWKTCSRSPGSKTAP